MKGLTTEKVIDQYFEKFGMAQKSMAASPESIKFCIDLINSENIESILDCGSGLSTALFNLELAHVESVDDDEYWSNMAKDFVKETMGREISIGPITEKMQKKYDFIFYDYGDMETRIYYLKLVLFMVNKYIYLDDMHIGYYQEYIKSVCKDLKLEILVGTKDEFGRFGALITK